MKQVVIGYGNQLRQDDGIGPYVVERLAQELNDDDVIWISCHQLIPELVTHLISANRVIFIDADVSGIPGAIHQREVIAGGSLPTWHLNHHCTPEALLASAAVLYDTHPKALCFTLSGATFEPGEAFSAAVATALDAFIATIRIELIHPEHG